jgi:hypothetical protein
MIPARGTISFRHATYNQFTKVPAQLASQLFRISFGGDLMQQIEQRDIEQLKSKDHCQN